MKTIIRTAGFTIVALAAVIAAIVISTRATESHESMPVAPSRTAESQPPSEPPEVEAPAQSPGGEAVPPDPATTSAAEVAIIGDAYCQTKTSEALALLRDGAQAHYDMVVSHVGVIECAEDGSGMFAWESPPRYRAGMATVEAGAVWYAGTIAHDACHAKQYQDYAQAHPSEQVPQEAFSGEQAEAQCLDVQLDALMRIGAGQDALDTVQTALSTRYWEVDYEERWW